MCLVFHSLGWGCWERAGECRKTGHKKAVVALAAKTVRVIWAMMARQERYQVVVLLDVV